MFFRWAERAGFVVGVALSSGCGGLVDPATSSTPTDARVDSEADASAAKAGAAPPADGNDAGPAVVDPVPGDGAPELFWAGCGGINCVGGVIPGPCRSAAEWKAIARAKCREVARELLYFEIGDLCSGGGRVGKYSCCPSTSFKEPIPPSSPTCPATHDTWAPGAACTAPMLCHYPDACGQVLNWHCKAGWSSNTSCYCPK